MSAPFDPTKLDLDINSTPETPQEKKEDQVSSSSEQISDDILGASTPTVTPVENTPEVQEKSVVDDILNQVTPEAPVNNPETKKPEVEEEATQETSEKDATEEKDIPSVPTTTPTSTSENKPEEILPSQAHSSTSAEETPVLTQEEKKLIDINISSLEDLVTLINEKKYDYITIEPEDLQVKIVFKQDNIDRDIKYIKFPTYTNILFKIKQVVHMEMENTGTSQEGKASVSFGSKSYKIAAKTAPGQNGERIWLKSIEDTSKKGVKKAKKTSLSMIFAFLGTILFIALVLGGAFIAFIVLNAKTVEDVKFFASLGINLNDINTFISQIVTLIFSILLFISTAALSFGLFKFMLTKKIYKRKKIIYGLLSGFLLMITFATGSAWMIIDQKIKGLPNWQEQAYGDLKIFDNSLLISQDFDANQALLTETENLIGPMTLKFDLENFQNNQARKGLTIKKYIWDFGDETIESFSPNITKVFDKKRNYEVSVTAIGEDLQGEEVRQELSNIPAITISHLIDVTETVTSNGGKRLAFDASDLKNLGKVEWYFKEAQTENGTSSYTDWTSMDEGYEFIPGKIFFDEIFVGVSIISGEQSEATIDKVIVISPDGNSDISGEIDFDQDLVNELDFTFFVNKPSTGFANGFIESYDWEIESKTYSTRGDFNNTEKSPEVEHEFKSFGDHDVKVTLTDSKGKTQVISKTITIQKSVELRSPLVIRDSNDEEFDNLKYEKKAHEYYLDGLGIPSELKFDARYVRPVNILYSLQNVTWDVGNDGDIDAQGKSFTHEVPTEGNHVIVAEYHFVHRKNSDDSIKLKEHIYIEGIKKEAILDLKIEKDSNYAPVTVRFDASKSFIKNDDIIKFNYDYGDGISEERDAINPGHKYGKAGDYTITLTVTGETGKTYSLEKKLILLPAPQEVKISTSLKKAPIGQGIDFSSAESEGQIVEYFWDFGDGNVSTQANPTHTYTKSGNYKVKLKVDFANNNSITDETAIEIYKE